MPNADNNLETMLRHAMTALLWTELDDEDNPLDYNYGPEDVTREAWAELRGDLSGFVACVVESASERALEIIMDDVEQAGHDFVLTRNGHGAGFWDRGYGGAGDELTKWAKTFGEMHAYVGDDGKVHVS